MSRKTGTTLIELLLAIAIALLVIGVVYSMYHTTTRIIGSQDARQDGPAAAARALDLLIRDLSCAAIPDENSDCGFSLGAPETGDPEEVLVRFCTAGMPVEDDFRWFEFENVLYRFQPGFEKDGVLSRESAKLSGPGSGDSVITNILATRIERFELEAFDGGEWHRVWDKGGLPRGARLTLVSEGRSYTAEAFIPAANVITSPIIRAATTSP
jgi:type II secretory pathway component PulJ